MASKSKINRRVTIEIPFTALVAFAAIADREKRSLSEVVGGIALEWLGACDRVGNPSGPDAPPPASRTVAIDRVGIVRRWNELCRLDNGRRGRAAITTEFLGKLALVEGTPISRGTLYRWDRLFAQGGIDALMDGRSNTRAAPSPDGRFLAEVRRLYRSSRKPCLAACHRAALSTAKAMGWPTRSYKSAQRFIGRAGPIRGAVEATSKGRKTSAKQQSILPR